LVEKPLEVTTKRCDQLIAECDKNHVYLGTIFPSRFHRSAILMKAAVEQGRFGSISVADAIVKWFRTQQYYESGKWRGTWALDGGGALMNQAIHSVDLLLWLMGPVRAVTAMTALRAHERIEVEDTAVATLEFQSGALGTIVVRWNFAKSNKQDEKILSQMASNSTGGGASDPAAIGHVAHRELFKDFAKAIEAGLPSRIDGTEGRRSVELINAIYKSAKTGKRISLQTSSGLRS
jgi:predicted dehydrogenase